MSLISSVVLHTGHGLILGEYLFRVIVHLLAVVGIGVTVHWLVRAIETNRSEIDGRGRVNDNEP
jgi:hypothetical protein